MSRKDRPNASRPRAFEEQTEELVAAILEQPGIRPSQINRRLERAPSDSLRATLIRRGLVRKVKQGHATRVYPA